MTGGTTEISRIQQTPLISSIKPRKAKNGGCFNGIAFFKLGRYPLPSLNTPTAQR